MKNLLLLPMAAGQRSRIAGPGPGGLLLLALLAPAGAAYAQGPTITAIVPALNARSVPRNSPVVITFSQPLAASSAGALQVFSSQQGGRRTQATPAVVSGNTLRYGAGAAAFAPGEVLSYTVSSQAVGTGGALAQGRVGQFTAAAGGTGTGAFQEGSNPAVDRYPRGLALGDIDGDGDLDLLAASSQTSQVSVRLNDGAGNYSGTQAVPVGNTPYRLALGDIDGDGDLDFVTANFQPSTVSVRQNNGSGTFVNTQTVPVGTSPNSVVLADMDGDGDLDLLTANEISGTVSLRLNDGTGLFGGTIEAVMGLNPASVQAADVNGDGNLDLLATNQNGNTVTIRLNSGGALLGGLQTVTVGTYPVALTLADLDGDGDLDLLTGNTNGSFTASIRFNNGLGTFGGGQEVVVGSVPVGITTGDIDHDGDLDLLTAGFNTNAISVRLNNGLGAFSGSQEVVLSTTAANTRSVALGDADGDGDLDLFATNESKDNVSVRLNQPPGQPMATAPGGGTPAFGISPSPARRLATLHGARPGAFLTLTDLLGRPVLTAQADAGGAASLYLPAGLAPGVYVARSGAQVARLVVE